MELLREIAKIVIILWFMGVIPFFCVGILNIWLCKKSGLQKSKGRLLLVGIQSASLILSAIFIAGAFGFDKNTNGLEFLPVLVIYATSLIVTFGLCLYIVPRYFYLTKFSFIEDKNNRRKKTFLMFLKTLVAILTIIILCNFSRLLVLEFL